MIFRFSYCKSAFNAPTSGSASASGNVPVSINMRVDVWGRKGDGEACVGVGGGC